MELGEFAGRLLRGCGSGVLSLAWISAATAEGPFAYRHFCGIFCHKPTWGLVPLRGHSLCEMAAEVDIAAIGPLGRSASDLAIALDLLTIPDPDVSGLPTSCHRARRGSLACVWRCGQRTRQRRPMTKPSRRCIGRCYGGTGRVGKPSGATRRLPSKAHQLYVSLLSALNSGFQSDAEVAQMQAQAVGLAPEEGCRDAPRGRHEPSQMASAERAALQVAAHLV